MDRVIQFAASLTLAAFTGCATVPAPSRSPSLPGTTSAPDVSARAPRGDLIPPISAGRVTAAVKHRQSAAVTARPPGILQLPPFVYPADMTNYEWTLEFSVNLVDWDIIAGPFANNLPGGTLAVTNQGACGFWRMHGVSNHP